MPYAAPCAGGGGSQWNDGSSSTAPLARAGVAGGATGCARGSKQVQAGRKAACRSVAVCGALSSTIRAPQASSQLSPRPAAGAPPPRQQGGSLLWHGARGGVGQQQRGERRAVCGQRRLGDHRHAHEGGGALPLAQLLRVGQLGCPAGGTAAGAAIKQGFRGGGVGRRAAGQPPRPVQPLTGPPPARRCGPPPASCRPGRRRRGWPSR